MRHRVLAAAALIELGLLGSYALVAGSAGEQDRLFWFLLLSQWPGFVVMSPWERLDGMLPAGVYLFGLYSGIFVVQVVLLWGLWSVLLRLKGKPAGSHEAT